ncbi:MAG: glucose-6-phosphate isomerase [Hahellaceae bacterium]|nr:glucose-6-phosphate isomerase [Hahellaceae bacterium]
MLVNEWGALSECAARLKSKSVAQLFEADPGRSQRYSLEFSGYYLDFAKQRIDDQAWGALCDLARISGLPCAIKKLVCGEVVNPTENRPALHTALRAAPKAFDLKDASIAESVAQSLSKMASIVAKIYSKQWRGFSGKAITDIVNIGVGGSDLGPFMTCHALDEFSTDEARRLNMHFVSSMDGTQIFQVLEHLDPATTLFIVSSKSFTTIDTFYNANTAIAWLMDSVADRQVIMRHHVIAISASPEKMNAWGVPESNQLLFWEWVGGRFSMWSAIGLPIAIKIGMDNFLALLDGAHEMDVHFATAPFEQNMPVIMGLLGVWNATFLGINAHTVLPYDGRLRFLPNYLTQLEMESNGKSVTNDGETVEFKTCPILWGDVGPNAQHAFYQLLHQGTQEVSCDFIAPVMRYHKVEGASSVGARTSLAEQQCLALANCLAQSRVLAFGNHAVADDSDSEVYKRYRGNQPSTTLLMDELTPRFLGGLLAAYEHKVFVMATLWNINPFDQWGVELGKNIAKQTQAALKGEGSFLFDSSTDALIKRIQAKANTAS